ncbi:hypothetical protein EDB80DRAFT_64426 [Ilyonectria destructans]|nr:hypothetical protein EDB80DRAFT_64426 [Ilyonectria destructans]
MAGLAAGWAGCCLRCTSMIAPVQALQATGWATGRLLQPPGAGWLSAAGLPLGTYLGSYWAAGLHAAAAWTWP